MSGAVRFARRLSAFFRRVPVCRRVFPRRFRRFPIGTAFPAVPLSYARVSAHTHSAHDVRRTAAPRRENVFPAKREDEKQKKLPCPQKRQEKKPKTKYFRPPRKSRGRTETKKKSAGFRTMRPRASFLYFFTFPPFPPAHRAGPSRTVRPSPGNCRSPILERKSKEWTDS